MWTPDLPGEVARLEALGFRSEMSGIQNGQFPSSYSYHYNHHGGLWIEVLSQELYEGLESYFAGGPLLAVEQPKEGRIEGLD
jgi:hypothetical protein